ncbi:MAG: BamA/TamA family outer membrane protein [Saprospiraceae bacterium]
MLCSLGAACNTNKYVAEEAYLYGGTQIEMAKTSTVKSPKKLSTALERYARPKKNSGFGLWVYNTFHNPKKTDGFRNKIANTFGQAPNIFNAQEVQRSKAIMENYLQDNGYFNSSVKSDTSLHKNQIKVKYTVQSAGQYKIRNVFYPEDTSLVINRLINQNLKKSAIKSNRNYQVGALEAERIRLSNKARNNGYFEFNKDFIYYFVDTTVAPLQADIFLKISDQAKIKPFYVDTAFVFPTFNLEETSDTLRKDTLNYQDLKIIQHTEFVRPATLNRVVTQEVGETYQKKLQDQTVNHLLDLGIFKFVNVKYQTQVRNDSNFLQRLIYLTPTLTQDLNGEIEASTETTNFLGSAVSGSYTHRNFMHGAEEFNFRLSAGVETQINNPELPFINTLELSAGASLAFPRFIIPFRKDKAFTYYIPKTVFSLRNNYQQRQSFFTINSFEFDIAYKWQTTRYHSYSFKPLTMNLVQLLETTDDFDQLLASNSRLRQSFDNIAILGMSFQFTYNEQELNTLKNYLFFRYGIETSGNLVSLFTNANNRLFGTQFSQFVRLDTETRYNILNPKNSWVARLAVGVGYSYNNSQVMPYTKQYFVGGANSIRAFQLRGVGPGSVPPDTTVGNTGFFDQTGDIKLEANVEYRFDLFPYTEGAAFIDAGNVWFLRNQDGDDRFREAQFKFKDFYRQLAVGAGLGLRLDLEFLILRFDAAIPLRQPTRPPGQRWVFDEIDFGSSVWRGDNLSFNLAIGYPF